jgi:hypothetical protein
VSECKVLGVSLPCKLGMLASWGLGVASSLASRLASVWCGVTTTTMCGG